MIGWWCADISFWGAAGLLGLLGALQGTAALCRSRRSRAMLTGRPPEAGQLTG